MNEPKRWLNDGAPPMIGQVLQAASNEQPSSGSLERALASVALGAGVTGAATSASGAAAVSSSGVFLKWTVLGCAVTLGTVGAGLGLGALDDAAPAPQAAPAAAHPATPAVNDRTLAAPAVSSDVEDDRTSPEQSPVAPPSRRETERRHADTPLPTAAPVVPVEDVDLLAQETRFIERARAESAAGRPAVAVAALDEYERRFPVRRYGPEALYLRMEALLALGQHAAARQVATRLATTFPSSPHAARAEAVRGAKIP